MQKPNPCQCAAASAAGYDSGSPTDGLLLINAFSEACRPPCIAIVTCLGPGAAAHAPGLPIGIFLFLRTSEIYGHAVLYIIAMLEILNLLDIVLPLLAAALLMTHSVIFAWQTLGQPAHDATVPEALNVMGLCVALAWFLYFWA